MLLPSDVARLVLGYLQEEGLSATTQAFIHECPNLKEYAEHTTADGTIPACVFSVFGKGLTTILNEYVAAKAKESRHEVPAMMTSLWKKLDFTLNQIKSLQNSPAISAIQRTRSRIGVANMARQRVLTVSSAGGVVCSSVSETSSIISPALSSHSMLSHSTPVSYTATQTRLATGSGSQQQIGDVSRILNTPRDSPVQIIVSEQRLNQGPMSPGRRKWDTPRKRGGAQSGSSTPGRSAMTVNTPSAEPQPEETVDENFPQLVIQNARDKILGDRSLQEKLAENINKILANEPTPQSSKAPSSTVEADQSIDEILGLQGEIHMSDDAIHDILEQTESDPAFQALFELFDYNKTKFTDGEAGDGDISTSPEESDTAGPSSIVEPLQSDEPGTTQREANASDTTPVTVKMRAGQERKTRKLTASTLLKKTVLGPSGRASRIENSSAKLLVSHGDHRGVSSTAVNSNRKEKASLFSNSDFGTPMDIDEPLNTPPPPADCVAMQETSTKDSTSVTIAPSEPNIPPSAAFAVPEVTSNVDKKQQHKQAQGCKVQPLIAPCTFLFPSQVEPNNTPASTADLPHTSLSNSGRDTQTGSTVSVTPESASCTPASSSATVTTAPASPSSVSTVAPFTATPCSPTSASTSSTITATPGSSSPVSPTSSSSCVPVSAAPDPPTTPSKAAADSSNIVSLKIIITDNQDEESPSDKALNQAISSISGDKIPTIYLSSPAKTSGGPGTPKANLDEAAQAVSGLQSSEAHGSPLSYKAGALLASPLTGTSQAQQNYIIQLPLDTTNPALQGATASYFLVTEPPSTDVQTRQVLLSAGVSKGQPLPTNQYGVTTPTRSQGYSPGSTLILPSPVKPMVLPVSVMGQNTLGKVQMVSNQLVAIPSPVPVQQSEAVKSKSPAKAIKPSTPAGTEQHLVGKLVQPALAENTGQQDASKGSRFRRILCFDSSAEVQPQTATTTTTTTPSATNTSPSQSVHQTEKDHARSVPRTKPAILGGNKPKRRVETIRCSADPQTGGSFMKDAEKSVPPQHQQKDPLKKNSRKQDHSIHTQESQSSSNSKDDASQPETLKKSETGGRSKSTDRKHSHNKDGGGAKAKDPHTSRSLSSDSALKSGTRKEKEESSRKEPTDKAPAKVREGRTEKRTPSQEMPNVTANKENEMKGSLQEQQQSTPSSSALRDLSPPAVAQPASNPQSKATKAPSKTSSLAKQAAEMLQDIQGLGSPSTPIKRPGAGSSDHSLPRTLGTGRNQEASPERPRTPSRQRKGRDGEATPKHLMPPNTPDVPTCSPASEAGSENSINMAAHTLMILSRAAIARTGTPLKDSLRQEEVREGSPTSSKNSKKRKQSSPSSSPPAKKESKQSPSKKKDRERKKLVECFPHDLDVDKFLSSLHYDE
ncbi:protein NPAT isoform X1 [Epinephelus moara]|uniref:protein NPAT isoform X1 n=1 Tax=Epinephelus moara TaxID=300413 RepID=UPI00214E6CB9|nr:protein NPAT isoform X1 [Epinephelus moara]